MNSCFVLVAMSMASSIAAESLPTGEINPITSTTIAITEANLPPGIIREHLNYVSVGGDEDRPDSWTITDARILDLGEGDGPTLFVVARSYQGEMAAAAGVFVFKPESGPVKVPWRFLGYHGAGEYCEIQFARFKGITSTAIVVSGGLGNHGSYMAVLRLDRTGLIELGDFEGYGRGVGLRFVQGEAQIVNHHQELPFACEACQSYYTEPMEFDGTKFVAKPDDFVACLNGEVSRHGEGPDGLECFLAVLKGRPRFFGALVQAEYLLKKRGDIVRSGELAETILDLKPEELSYEPGDQPDQAARQRYIADRFGQTGKR